MGSQFQYVPHAISAHTAPKIVKNSFFYTLDQLDKAVPAFLALLPASRNRSEVLGAMGMASMWLAIFADVGVMVLAVLNSMRTLRRVKL